MKYLLDTDHISFLQRRASPEHAVLAAKVAQHAASDFAFSVISFHEQVLGAHTLISRARTVTEVTAVTLFWERFFKVSWPRWFFLLTWRQR